ncbi:hypothetical protein, partial [Ectothiorhodospira variabilis]|uniref:hypothetical protein n=1 Tax=Ectothiorhodospira variabilis TaxID=505694 RepID=UPI001EFAE23D
MMDSVSFINLEETDKDLILSFALDEGDGLVRSLILHRMLFFESILPEEERGTKVSLEGEDLGDEQEYLNTLEEFQFDGDVLRIKSRFRLYVVDAGGLSPEDFEVIKKALERQNHDARFQVKWEHYAFVPKILIFCDRYFWNTRSKVPLI